MSFQGADLPTLFHRNDPGTGGLANAASAIKVIERRVPHVRIHPPKAGITNLMSGRFCAKRGVSLFPAL